MKENHNIDKLFFQKLKDHEIAPSNEAWKKIESLSVPKQRKIIPLYWAAACILILATISVMRWGADQAEFPKEIAKLEQPIIHSNETIDRFMKDESRLKLKEQVAKLKLPEQQKEKLTLSKNTATSDLALSKETIYLEPVVSIKEHNSQETTIPTRDEVEEKEQQIAVAEEINSITIVENNRVLVAEIKVTVSEQENDLTKEKRVRKIFKQLKNLKNGGDVNWDEVGVNPKQLIARVDPLQASSRH